ncbi:unnamed protein product [Ixodes hexagonus]
MNFGCIDDHSGIRYYLQEARQVSLETAKKIRLWECAINSTYRQAWENAERLYEQKRVRHRSHSWDLVEKDCYVAIMCYTLKIPNVCRDFNDRCRRASANETSWKAFPFKSLWYFLIRAFEKLPPCSVEGEAFFRGVDVFKSDENRMVPFAQFVSGSVSRYQAAKFGRGKYVLTLDCVPQELVRDISLYSVYEHHKEVLIWPFCTFKDVSAADASMYKRLVFISATPWVEQSPSTMPSLAVTSDSIKAQMSEAASVPSAAPAAQPTVTMPCVDALPAVPAKEEPMAPESAKMTRVTLSPSQLLPDVLPGAQLPDVLPGAPKTLPYAKRRPPQQISQVEPKILKLGYENGREVGTLRQPIPPPKTLKTSLFESVPKSRDISKKEPILQQPDNMEPRTSLSGIVRVGPSAASDKQHLLQQAKRAKITKSSSSSLNTGSVRRIHTAPSSREEGLPTARVPSRMARPNSPEDPIGPSCENHASTPKLEKTKKFLVFVFRSLCCGFPCGSSAGFD